jgi:DNA-binding winged helix-turn-helix (wHTH) protein/tetratricopeptide (TPR) repeat protein
MSLEKKEIFEFGDFRLDVEERSIKRLDGVQKGALPEKAFQALVLLVRRHGHLVSKDELIRYVWPDTFVEDNNLEKCVHQLRHFVGETSNGNKYIETVRKHGYRFVAKVNVVEVSGSWLAEDLVNNGDQCEALSVPNDLVSDPIVDVARAEETGHRFHFSWVMTLIVVALGVLTGLGYYAFVRPGMTVRSGAQVKGGTNNEEAHRYYMLAANLSEERGVKNVMTSLEYLNKAVELDPGYALAWAGKALIHRDVVGHGSARQLEHYQQSMAAIDKALAIEPDLADAYSALCQNKNRYEYDFTGAEKACRRAIELDPRSPVAHKMYAQLLYTRGRFNEAIAEIKAAMDLQPVSYRNQQIYALTLYYARRHDEAAAEFRRLLELNPSHAAFLHDRLIRVFEAQKKEPEAFDQLIKMFAARKTEPEQLQPIRTAYSLHGWRGVLLEQIRIAEEDVDTSRYQLACLYAKAGIPDKALENLEKAYEERNFQISVIQVDPDLDALRPDARFIGLVNRVEGK